MILVTRLDRQIMLLNPDHIVTIEETPDTVVTLFNGHHILIRERASIIVNRIVAFRSKLLRRAGSGHAGLKYLTRKNRNLFNDQSFAPVRSDIGHTPFHRQDS